MTIKKWFYFLTFMIVSSLSSLHFENQASINETTGEMQEASGKLRTHPLGHDDLSFWYELQASPPAIALFRDGRPRSLEECDPQAQYSIRRHESGNPLVVHVVDKKTEEFGWKPVGTIVMRGSEKEHYFEMTRLSHLAILQSTGDYLKDIDQEAFL